MEKETHDLTLDEAYMYLSTFMAIKNSSYCFVCHFHSSLTVPQVSQPRTLEYWVSCSGPHSVTALQELPDETHQKLHVLLLHRQNALMVLVHNLGQKTKV